MFNSHSYSESYGTQNLHINAVTGSILKNHPKSWFECFDLTSQRANELLREGGHMGGIECHRYSGSFISPSSESRTPIHDPEKDIVILQMIMCGDMKVLAECVYQKDYNAKLIPEMDS